MLRLINGGVIKQLVTININAPIFTWFANTPCTGPKIPRSIPVVTIIKATPITGIIPIPTLIDSRPFNPDRRAPMEPPRKFPKMPIPTKAAMNNIIPIISGVFRRAMKSKLAPTHTKNNGMKNAYPMFRTYSTITAPCGVFRMNNPAMNAPIIAVIPRFSANAANKKQITRPLVRITIGAFRPTFLRSV